MKDFKIRDESNGDLDKTVYNLQSSSVKSTQLSLGPYNAGPNLTPAL